MTTYKIKFALRSSVRSAFQSDTIFGHICWAYRYLKGEKALLSWLDSSRESPTLVSNAYPVGFVPKPIVKPLNPEQIERLFHNENGKDAIEKNNVLKEIKKIHIINEKWFWENQANLTSEILMSYLYENGSIEKKNDSKTELIPHNRYNRKTGRVDSGGLYDTEETFYFNRLTSMSEHWFLIRTETVSLTDIKNVMNYIGQSGFGADKSTGKGALKVLSIEPYQIPEPENANACITFSNFIPDRQACLNGYYKTITKYGKLGGSYASGNIPFKRPVMMLEAGSLIRRAIDDTSVYYGHLLGGVHPMKTIVQYGYAFPIPVHYKEMEI